MEKAKICYTRFEKIEQLGPWKMGGSGPLSSMKTFFWFLPGNTGLGKKGGNTEGATKKRFWHNSILS